MSARSIMIQGTGSSVGKSLIVTALCRIFARRGLRVAPFKAQNMSLNSFITEEGLEMGRAQVAQAEAAGIIPSALMNPVLLKPCGNRTSQVIVNGIVRETLDAKEYYHYRATLKDDVVNAFTTLADSNDLIIIEGAGSPAEINLRENDLANMGAAELVNAPVILAGDIDRGGVFASLYGTVKLLEIKEQQRIQGFIINKFRGDPAILEPGLRQLEYILSRPFLGVLPYFDVTIDEEDSLAERLSERGALGGGISLAQTVNIAVPKLPRLSNFTDFAVFDTIPDVRLRFATTPEEIACADMIVIPGTKSTMLDMLYLRESGLAGAILDAHAKGRPIVGICGGYQMLGQVIKDPLRIESAIPSGEEGIPGLGLLPMETSFEPHKRTTQTVVRVAEEAAGEGLLQDTAGMPLTGYEIHMGFSTPLDASGRSGKKRQHCLGKREDGTKEGMVRAGGTVFGTYLHGIFDNLAFTQTILNTLRRAKSLSQVPVPEIDASYMDFRQKEYDRLADGVEANLDIPTLEKIIASWPLKSPS